MCPVVRGADGLAVHCGCARASGEGRRVIKQWDREHRIFLGRGEERSCVTQTLTPREAFLTPPTSTPRLVSLSSLAKHGVLGPKQQETKQSGFDFVIAAKDRGENSQEGRTKAEPGRDPVGTQGPQGGQRLFPPRCLTPHGFSSKLQKPMFA